MAISKVILNGDTLMDVTSDTVEAGKLLSGETATKNDGTKVTGNYAVKLVDLTVIPYEYDQSYSVENPFGLAYCSGSIETLDSWITCDISKLVEGEQYELQGSITDEYGNRHIIGKYETFYITWDSSHTINVDDYVFTIEDNKLRSNKIANSLKLEFLHLVDGWDRVVVEAIPSDYVGSSVPLASAQTITPTESIQTAVPSGYYTTGPISVGAISSNYIGSAVPSLASTNGTIFFNIPENSDYGTVTGKIWFSSGYLQSNNYAYSTTQTIPLLRSSTIVPTSSSQLIATTGSYVVGDIYVDAIPSAYIIPSGTYSISSNGTYDVESYKSVSVNATGEYYGIYKALAQGYRVTTNGTSAYTAQEVSNYCDSLSYIDNYQFVGRDFTPSGVTFNNVSRVGDGAFGSIVVGAEVAGGYYGSITYSFPNCTLISSAAFRGNTLIKEINAPECSIIGAYAFYGCTSLTTINFSKCTSISIYGFYSCHRLTVANFPKCTSIGLYGFQYCSKLLEANFPLLSEIETNVFSSCQQLSIASFPMVTTIGSGAFAYCHSLVTISFPLATVIQSSAFTYCINLSTIDFPNCSYIEMSAFQGCYNLSIASFPLIEVISGSAFQRCYNLLSLYLLGSSVPTLISYTAFTSTPISTYTTSTGGIYGSIFVPASLYNDYITATNWSRFSSRFVSV